MRSIYGSDIHPCVSEMSLRSSIGLSRPITSTSWTTPNSPIGKNNQPLVSHPPLICAIHDISVFVKKLFKI